jgi:hypothetical protein
MFKIEPKLIEGIVSKHFDESDPLLGYCVGNRLRFVCMNSGTKYIGYSTNKIVLCQMLGTKKEISNDVIQIEHIFKIKKSKIPFSKIYTIFYKKNGKIKSKYKLWFLFIRGYKENVAEAIKLIDMIKLKLKKN